MKDILSLFCAYARSGLKSRFQYKVDAIVVIFAVFLREAGGIIAMYLALRKFGTINGWNIDELLFLFSLIFITYGIFIVFFMALRDFPDWIKHGDFDRVLLRPRGVLTQLVLCGADWLAAFGHGTLGLLLLIISANRVGVDWNVKTVLYYVMCVIGGVLIQGAVFLAFSAVTFYVLETNSLKEIFYWNMRKFAIYPLSIYNKFIQVILLFVVPFAFVNYFPAQFFLHKPDMAAYPSYLMYLTPIVGAVLYLLAYAFWRFSLRFYKSTGN